jgi:hypothetical protein
MKKIQTPITMRPAAPDQERVLLADAGDESGHDRHRNEGGQRRGKNHPDQLGRVTENVGRIVGLGRLKPEDPGEKDQVGYAQDQQRPVLPDSRNGFLDRHRLRLVKNLFFAAGEAEQAEGVSDDGEHDGHGRQKCLKLLGLGFVACDLRSDHQDEDEGADDRSQCAPDAKTRTLHRVRVIAIASEPYGMVVRE